MSLNIENFRRKEENSIGDNFLVNYEHWRVRNPFSGAELGHKELNSHADYTAKAIQVWVKIVIKIVASLTIFSKLEVNNCTHTLTCI